MLPALLLLSILLPDAAIQGTVRVEGSGDPIPHATVRIPDLRRTASADAHGYFVIPGVPAGSWRVQASALGYRSTEAFVRVSSSGAVRLDFDLVREPVAISPLEVRAQRQSSAVSEAGPAPARIDARAVDLVPALAEADVLRAVQTLPSVAAASDFSSALYIRGGSPDQNLITLDGVPLFNPYHLGGVFGSVDPDAIASVEVLPGAFPARVGDRLSGVVNFRTRDGGRDQVRGNGAVGLISSRASLDGPAPGGRGSYLLSVRRTYLDLFTDAAQSLGIIPQTLPYAFTDAYLKLTHDVGAFGRISASVYVNEEDFHLPPELDLGGDAQFDWGSRMATLSYRQPFGATLVGDFRIATTSFYGYWDANTHSRIEPFEGPPRDTVFAQLRARATMRDLLASANFIRYGKRHETHFGVQSDNYVFDYDVNTFGQDFDGFIPDFRRTERPRTVAAYLEDEWTATSALRLRAGLRVLAAGERGTAWMPRLGIRYEVSPALALSLGMGRYAQVFHSMRDEESLAASLMAYDVVTTVPTASGLTTADDAVVGAEWTRGSTRLRVDAYVKRLHNVPLPPIPDEPLSAPVVVAEGFRMGTGSARGLEVLAGRTWGERGARLAYAFAYAEREVEGERFAPRFERRHTLDLSGYTALGKRGQATARLALATGQPYTPVVGITQGYSYDPGTKRFRYGGPSNGGTILLGEHNAERLPGYLRLDVGARKEWDKQWFGRTVTLAPYINILNVLNSPNVLVANPNANYDGRNVVLEYAPQFPIFPTFGVEWRF